MHKFIGKSFVLLFFLLFNASSYALDFSTIEQAHAYCAPLSSLQYVNDDESPYIFGELKSPRKFKTNHLIQVPKKMDTKGHIINIQHTRFDDLYGYYHCHRGTCNTLCYYAYVTKNNDFALAELSDY